MGNMVSREQALQVMAVLGNNADWPELSPLSVQSIIDNPHRAGEQFTRFLRKGSAGIENATGGVKPPDGGMFFNIPVWVDETLPWETALKNCDTEKPKTPLSLGSSEVWNVGDHYPTRQSVSFRVLTIVNFGKNITSDEILGWAFQRNLRAATPRACFAIGKQYRDIADSISVGYVAIVTLDFCPTGKEMRVPCISFKPRLIGARLPSFKTNWSPDHWFAFELKSGTN